MMDAGRDLDAVVARKVMNWAPSTHPKAKGALAPPDNLEGFYTEDDLPAFSEELHDAQYIIERMRADGFSFKALQPSKEPYNPGEKPVEIATVSFVCGAGPCPKHGNTLDNHHGAYDVEAPTLALAVCRAALAALEPPASSTRESSER